MSWTPCICEPAREAAGRGRGMGHVQVACNSCHDQLRQTVFFEPLHDSGHQPLTGWAAGPDLSLDRVGDDGQGDGNRPGRPGAATQTTQMISSAVCALTTLAFMFDTAQPAATAKAAGSGGWPSCLATRTVTSYLLGGSFMPGTVSVTCDIFSADLVSSIVLLDVWETPPPLLAGRRAPATCRPRTASGDIRAWGTVSAGLENARADPAIAAGRSPPGHRRGAAFRIAR